MIVMFGMVGGPLIAGILADRTGSYELGFRILAGLAGAGVDLLRARPPAAAAAKPLTMPPVRA